MEKFVHLHCHTQFSLLDGASEIGTMMDKAQKDGQLGVALTDHGNMFGAYKFVVEAHKRDLKPILGCEFYMVEDRHRKSFSRAKGEKDKRYHQLLLAKNKVGYDNLIKLCSLGFIDGLYGKYPRIDKELLEKHHEGLIGTSCCIGAEIPQAIIHGDLEGAEKKLKWWVDLLGEDFYIEIQRHRGLENIDIGRDSSGKPIYSGKSQEDVNQILIQFAKKYNLKVIATNDSHYVEEEDAAPHDILLAINTGSLVNDEKRFRFPSSDFYFKTQEEMNTLFGDVPQAIDNTMDIFHKVEDMTLARDILLPAFPLPDQFKNQDDFLRHLTYEGARQRYNEITPEISERLDFELGVIANSGYPGYFLIVQDFTTTAREMGVSVGPGRGSAAGSAVAYCTGITNIDPIKYDLLFERFLNPERVSMPDIDIDFDDEGRQKVIDYVIEKYGRNQVAQIVTYGTMAARMSMRDVGRVLDVPLYEVNEVAKTFPAHMKATLNKVLADGDINPKLKGDLTGEDLEKAYQFRSLAEQDGPVGEMLKAAKRLEGAVRNTGVHACGVVITPDDVTKFVPVKVDKDNDIFITQFDNSVAEDAGLLKMDFLGLKTLTIIKKAVAMAEENYDVTIDVEEVDLEDTKTYELFQRGETVGVFQYESPGMQKHMKNLVPSTFADLIAMNALYRPGPIEYIPEFIDRKHGRKPIVYDLADMKDNLEETYGITVYQEQVMLLSQRLANFTKGQADMLRKGMGKKKKAIIDALYPIFIEGGEKNGHPKDVLDKVWKDWEAFASYAFNKSHSTCYAFVAFQTAYLKAHYPAEFMASVLTNNKNDISKVTFFLEECRRMGVDVLGPDVNESKADFAVNKKGQIRFGMTALKGVGEGPVSAILEEREANGPFKTIYDMMRRMNLRAINKRVMESLADGGAFDLFEGMDRPQFFTPSGKYTTFIEHCLKYGAGYQMQLAQAATSLFGASDDVMIPEPPAPSAEPWPLIYRLNREKVVTGIFLSGHPLDDYKIEIDNFITCRIRELNDHQSKPSIKIAGLLTASRHLVSKNGNGWGIFEVSDYSDVLEFKLFGNDYQNFKNMLETDKVLFIKGAFRKQWNSEELEFKPTDITLLEGLAESMTESITLKIQLHEITDTLISDINTICEEHRGKHSLKMQIIDSQNHLKLDMMSSGMRVSVDNDFIQKITNLNLKYKLN